MANTGTMVPGDRKSWGQMPDGHIVIPKGETPKGETPKGLGNYAAIGHRSIDNVDAPILPLKVVGTDEKQCGMPNELVDDSGKYLVVHQDSHGSSWVAQH